MKDVVGEHFSIPDAGGSPETPQQHMPQTPFPSLQGWPGPP